MSNINGSWPTMAFDGTKNHPEGEHLTHYHRTAEKRGFVKHMPKNSFELDQLYKLYKNGLINDLKRTWIYIQFDIDEELRARILDRDLYFINKYLGYLDTFIDLTSSHSDRQFTSTLYDDNFLDTLENTLWETITHVTSRYINSTRSKNTKYTFKSTHIIYVVERIDSKLASVNKKRTNFLELFNELCLNNDYEQSKEYIIFKNIVKHDLENGGIIIPLNI